MLTGLLMALVIGVALGLLTTLDARLRIADEFGLAVLITTSGAIAAWAVLATLGVVGRHHGAGIADAVSALLGAFLILAAAWRGRRRIIVPTSLDELG